MLGLFEHPVLHGAGHGRIGQHVGAVPRHGVAVVRIGGSDIETDVHGRAIDHRAPVQQVGNHISHLPDQIVVHIQFGKVGHPQNGEYLSVDRLVIRPRAVALAFAHEPVATGQCPAGKMACVEHDRMPAPVVDGLVEYPGRTQYGGIHLDFQRAAGPRASGGQKLAVDAKFRHPVCILDNNPLSKHCGKDGGIGDVSRQREGHACLKRSRNVFVRVVDLFQVGQIRRKLRYGNRFDFPSAKHFQACVGRVVRANPVQPLGAVSVQRFANCDPIDCGDVIVRKGGAVQRGLDQRRLIEPGFRRDVLPRFVTVMLERRVQIVFDVVDGKLDPYVFDHDDSGVVLGRNAAAAEVDRGRVRFVRGRPDPVRRIGNGQADLSVDELGGMA